MALPSLAIKKWQFTIRDFFSGIHRLTTFITQDNTVIRLFTPLGDTSDNILPVVESIPPAFSAHSPFAFYSGLPSDGIPDYAHIKTHKDLPLYIWREKCGDNSFFPLYISDGEWTGIFVIRKYFLPLTPDRIIGLKPNIYRVMFCPRGDFKHERHIIDKPSLSKAKKIAEWYYEEWLKVNHDLLIRQKPSILSLKKSEGIENGNREDIKENNSGGMGKHNETDKA